MCTCVFLLCQESFDMILVNNSYFYDGVLQPLHQAVVRTFSFYPIEMAKETELYMR
jgi:hypothetical protein